MFILNILQGNTVKSSQKSCILIEIELTSIVAAVMKP